VAMKCLHYHGQFKVLMERHARGVRDDWVVARTLLRDKFQRLPAKLALFYGNYIAPHFRRRSL
jgi:hypothetical protein